MSTASCPRHGTQPITHMGPSTVTLGCGGRGNTEDGWTHPTQTSPVILHRALEYVRVLRRRQAEYDADVAAWYSRGDGRSPNWRVDITPDGEDVYRYNAGGKGYRYPVCIHGRSLWVDHDIPCGTCEDTGNGYHGITVYQLALEQAHRDYTEFKRRWAILAPLRTESSAPQHEDLDHWASEPLYSTV